MADINQIITLGIGTPSDIPRFILVGLNIPTSGVLYVNLHERPIANTLDDRDVSGCLYDRPIAVTLEGRP